VTLVDAPVSGSTQPAQDGQLVILAAGPPSTRPRLEPIFEPLARQILWLDHVGDGSKLKLALNNWLSVLVEGTAETLTLTSALGLDPHLFVTTIAGGPLGSRYATAKAIAMLDADFTPGSPCNTPRKTPRSPPKRPTTADCSSRSPTHYWTAGTKPSPPATATTTSPPPITVAPTITATAATDVAAAVG
jgi:hypothetical protein